MLEGRAADGGRGGRPLDWAAAEALAYASLLAGRLPRPPLGPGLDPRHVQPAACGPATTPKTGEQLLPAEATCRRSRPSRDLQQPAVGGGACWASNTATSLDYPDALVLWEAQFGDFANGAQVIIDQFIASRRGEVGPRSAAWCCCCRTASRARGRSTPAPGWSGSCSSAPRTTSRSTIPTTPAQYFHLLRRQVRREFRKPLIVMTPKSLLRHKQAVSPVDHLTVGRFHDVLDDPTAPDRVRRVLAVLGQGLLRPDRPTREAGSQREVAWSGSSSSTRGRPPS